MINPRLFTLVACVSLLAPVAQADPPQTTTRDAWYVVLLEDQRAGHVHQLETQTQNQITTQVDMLVQVGRGDAVIEINTQSTFTETLDGQPLTATSSLGIGQAGGVPIVTSLTFLGDTIRVTTTQGDQSQTTDKPAPKTAWLPPAAAARRVQANLDAGQKHITVTTLDPAVGLEPITTTMSVVGQQPVDLFGKTVQAIAWDAQLSNLPGIRMREYVDPQGHSLKSTVALMPGFELTILQADQQLALSPLDPPEIMASSLIQPAPGSVPIDHPRKTTHATYQLTVPAQAQLPTTPAQTIELIPNAPTPPGTKQVKITVFHQPTTDGIAQPDAWPKLAEATQNIAQDPDLQAHRQPSPIVDFQSASVQTLLETIKHTEHSIAGLEPAARAEQLRRFVHRTITTKDLSVGFATATETATTRQGDCTEHAVLLAALLRAHDIPSRAAAGLIYADQFLGHQNVFGFHLWTQAYIDPDGPDGPANAKWIDLDPTLGPDTPFDATHITLALSDLNDASPANQLVQLTPLIGQTQVRVVHAGNTPAPPTDH